MAYTVAVTWIAKPGEEDAVAAALQALVEPSRAEEGVLVYIPNRDPEDPTKFFIYEQYVDEAAYTAHTETEHFKTLRLRRRDPAPARAQARVLRADGRLKGISERPPADAGGPVPCVRMPKRVLVVDDHPAVALALKVFLRSDGRYEVAHSAKTAAEGLELLGDEDAVLLDLHLPDMSGLELVRAFREAGPGREADPALGRRRHARGRGRAPAGRRRGREERLPGGARRAGPSDRWMTLCSAEPVTDGRADEAGDAGGGARQRARRDRHGGARRPHPARQPGGRAAAARPRAATSAAATRSRRWSTPPTASWRAAGSRG